MSGDSHADLVAVVRAELDRGQVESSLVEGLLAAYDEVTPAHHGQPMRWRGDGTRWDAEFEITERVYGCVVCRTYVTVTTHAHVGPVPS